MGKIAATIDIGTNAVLLLIAEISPHPQRLPRLPGPSPAGGEGALKVLRDEARITRLGEGLHQQPLFLPAAQERTISVLREYRQVCDSLRVAAIAAVGTAAFRKAKNADDFIDRVAQDLDIKIEIISGDDEARLSFLSVETDFPQFENLIALDIGGGSTEIISKEGAVSLDLGAVVLTERIVKHDPPTEEEVQAMTAEIDHAMQSVGAGFKPAPTLVGLAGSVTTLSAIKQKLAVWDGAKVQGSILTSADLDEMIALFCNTTVEQKKKIVGMVRGREDTILAGALILKKVMEKLQVENVIVSDRGLRYGAFYEKFKSPPARNLGV